MLSGCQAKHMTSTGVCSKRAQSPVFRVTYGLEVNCSWLAWLGLDPPKTSVVIARRRKTKLLLSPELQVTERAWR